MQQDDVRPQPPRRRYRLAAGAIAAATVLAVTATAVIWQRGQPAERAAPAATIATKTVTIARGDLKTSRSMTGTLGYGASRTVKTDLAGVVTWLPAPGTVVKRGQTLFRVNDEAVPLFIGSPPLYRTLSVRNTVGRDIAMVAKNLRALGYAVGEQPRPGQRVQQRAERASGDVTGAAPPDAAKPIASPAGTPPSTRSVLVRAGDGVLTSTLIKAVKRWQHDQGLPQSGQLQVGDLAVMPGQVRVDAVTAAVGDRAVGELMVVTRTTRMVTVRADVAEAGSLRAGDSVTVRLSDGAKTPGEIDAIATVAQQAEGQDAAGGGGQNVTVTVTLTDRKTAGRLDGGQVEVQVEGEIRKQVLTVPVNALIALSEGGYALQLTDGSLRSVQTGLFAAGVVEVSGPGVTEGLVVVTTS